ncbi:MAG: transglutaminase domain-containing protein [Polyangiales bacterium]
MRWVIAAGVPPAKRVALLDALANDAMRMPAVQQLARLVPRAATERARAESLLALLHKLTYRMDPPGEEVFQTADETIARSCGGDCEDLAALFVALAQLVGLRVKIVWLNQQIHGARSTTCLHRCSSTAIGSTPRRRSQARSSAKSPAHASRRRRQAG